MQNGPIVYQRTNYPSAQLWEIEPDGSKNHPLTSGPLPEPDAVGLAGRTVDRLRAWRSGPRHDRGAARPTSRHAAGFPRCLRAAWSPRGDRIAFDGTHGGKYGVYAIGWDGRHITKIYAETSDRPSRTTHTARPGRLTRAGLRS